jgi:WhiB family redox-sensing transcriptional regulator
MTLDWQDSAACATTDPEVFFPPTGDIAETARNVCKGCEVRLECLAYAMEHEPQWLNRHYRYGVWGGLTPTERARLGDRRVS